MSAPLNPVGGGACCAPQCSDAPAFRVPGPAGHDSFTFTSANFVMPSVGLTVVVSVIDSAFIGLGQTLFIEQAGFMQVTAVSGLNVTLDNLGAVGNAQPGLTILSGKKVSPGGVGGNTGNAFTNTTSNFTMPAANTTVAAVVISTAWMGAGQPIFVTNAGIMLVSSIQSGTNVTLVNLGYPQNVAPGTNVPTGQFVSPSGFNGQQGATGLGTLNSISPTTTKGDLIVDNGGASPSANDVRLAAGSNGQLLATDSSQPTGLGWKTVLPNSVATDGDIVIFNGTSGTPNAVKDSKLLISSTGAIQSTPTGGNARGTSAVDLQVVRTANTQVASGVQSALLGGQKNTASGQNSFIGGGENNTASGLDSTVAGGNTNSASNQSTAITGGNSNTASGSAAAVVGGASNTASGLTSCVVGGNTNLASGDYSFCGGGQNNTASGLNSTCLGSLNFIGANGNAATIIGGTAAAVNLYGQVAHANGFFASAGDAQTSELIWRIGTTDATANVELFLDGSSLRAVVPLNTTWAFEIWVVGRSSAGVSAVWRTIGGIQNISNTVTLIAASTQAVVVDGTTGTWGVTGSLLIDADNTNKSLRIRVTGAAATSIHWVARARLVEAMF